MITGNTFCYIITEPKLRLQYERKQSHGFLTDIYDGNVWKEFQSSEKNSFLTHRNNYGLMFNLDWFQPFKHVKYSVGVLSAVILNLPKEERFKIEKCFIDRCYSRFKI